MRALLLALVLGGTAAALPVEVTFYNRTGNLPKCEVHRPYWKQLAVSRDLIGRYPCGTRLRLTFTSPVGGRRVVEGIVTDLTGEDARNTVDVLVPTRAEALRYGRVRATVRRLP